MTTIVLSLEDMVTMSGDAALMMVDADSAEANSVAFMAANHGSLNSVWIDFPSIIPSREIRAQAETPSTADIFSMKP